jgi:hypothetical protein
MRSVVLSLPRQLVFSDKILGSFLPNRPLAGNKFLRCAAEGQSVEQKLMLGFGFTCDQIDNYQSYNLGHTFLCYLSTT